MKIVCISGKAQHGKDTSAVLLAEYLEQSGKKVLVTHFADLLKYICKAFFGWNGEKDDYGRTLLQYVGTDVVRVKAPDFWVDFIVKVLTLFDGEWDFVLLPDCRFPNEYETFKNHGFDVTLLKIQRTNFVSPLSDEQQKHASETAFDGYMPDYTIVNDDDIKTLTEQIILFANRECIR